MVNTACTIFQLTPEEALAGVTRNAAKALGLEQRIGSPGTGEGRGFRGVGDRGARGTRLRCRLQPLLPGGQIRRTCKIRHTPLGLGKH